MDVSDYKASRIHKYKLPSGLVIKTKSLSPYSILKLRAEEGEGEEKVFNLYSKKIMDKLFELFIIDPKIGEELKVEDFNHEDFIEISGLILKQVMLTKAEGLEELKAGDFGKDFSTPSK